MEHTRGPCACSFIKSYIKKCVNTNTAFTSRSGLRDGIITMMLNPKSPVPLSVLGIKMKVSRLNVTIKKIKKEKKGVDRDEIVKCVNSCLDRVPKTLIPEDQIPAPAESSLEMRSQHFENLNRNVSGLTAHMVKEDYTDADIHELTNDEFMNGRKRKLKALYKSAKMDPPACGIRLDSSVEYYVQTNCCKKIVCDGCYKKIAVKIDNKDSSFLTITLKCPYCRVDMEEKRPKVGALPM